MTKAKVFVIPTLDLFTKLLYNPNAVKIDFMFHENQQIGFYTLIKKLGRGGFGEVWLAERRAKFVTTKVAVKLPLDEQIDHEAIKHEATLWEQASGHPNIVPIIDADEYDGQIVIVSEYAPDGSLEEWLKKHGAMSVERAIETTIQILDGLEFLHSRHIIHRDLKPANILLQGKTPRLADFGISRALRTTVASQSQNISGTFAYMSPEALDGKRSIQTDVWSVGVNLYQFLTGTLPFPQKEPSVLFPAIIMREFAPLPDSIPQSLKNVMAKALAKLPENRYKTAGEMREDLADFLINNSYQKLQPTLWLNQLDQTQASPTARSILPINAVLQNNQSDYSYKNQRGDLENTVIKEKVKKLKNEYEDTYQKELEIVVDQQEARLERIERRKKEDKRAFMQFKFTILFTILSLFPSLFLASFLQMSQRKMVFLFPLTILTVGIAISYSTFRNSNKRQL